MTDVLKRMMTRHRDDGANVAFDVVCIALSIALIPTGIGIAAGIALAGGIVLLGADGYAYGLELAGDDSASEAFKKQTEKWRILATVMTLPDGLVGGWKALRELSEVREALVLDRTTAATAEQLSARTANAQRADRSVSANRG